MSLVPFLRESVGSLHQSEKRIGPSLFLADVQKHGRAAVNQRRAHFVTLSNLIA